MKKSSRIGSLFQRIGQAFDKNYLARVGLSVLTGVLALGAIVYMSYHLIDRFSPGLDLIDAIPTTLVHTIETDGYILRSEKPIYAASVTSGSASPAFLDGGRVAKYVKIADIYANSAPDVQTRMAEIDEQIALLRKNESEQRSVQSTAGLESQIYDTVFAIRSKAADGAYGDALSLRTELLVNIQKRGMMSGQIQNYSSQIAKLEAEKNELKASLGTCLESILSTDTGYFYEEYDGYGTVFSADLVDTLTYDSFLERTHASPEYEDGFCVGVLVTDYLWYLACRVTKAEASELADVYSCDVTFPYSDETIPMEVCRIAPQTPGDEAIVILRSGKMPVGFDYTRMQPVKLSGKEYTGFEIPVEAVRVVGDFEGVYVLNEVTVEFRRIHVIYEGDGTVIATGNPDPGAESTGDDAVFPWIDRNDIIVVSGTELYSGKVIG